MADRVRKVGYCYVKTPNRVGQGMKILEELAKAGVNLLVFSGFPDKGGKAQLDLVAEDLGHVRRIARRNGWRLSKTKRAFLIQGADAAGVPSQASPGWLRQQRRCLHLRGATSISLSR